MSVDSVRYIDLPHRMCVYLACSAARERGGPVTSKDMYGACVQRYAEPLCSIQMETVKSGPALSQGLVSSEYTCAYTLYWIVTDVIIGIHRNRTQTGNYDAIHLSTKSSEAIPPIITVYTPPFP